jgi:DNA polymerase III gamma/tau subunit
MKGSILFYGGNKTDLENRVVELVKKISGKDFSLQEIKDPDIKVIGYEAEKILTTEIEDAVNFLHEKPYAGAYKILAILQADKIQNKTQNLLLKTLEEPPTYASIILASKTLQDILETVQSRCRKISVKRTILSSIKGTNAEDTKEEVEYKKFILLDYGKKLSWAEEFAKEDKEIILNQLENWMEQGRVVLKENPTTTLKNLEAIKEIKRDLENTNVNTRLALETLVISLE